MRKGKLGTRVLLTAATAALLLLCACSAATETSPIVHVTASATAPASTDAPSARPAQAVTWLSDLTAPSSRSYLSLGEGLALSLYTDYGETESVSYVEKIEVRQGKVLASVTKALPLNLIKQRFKDGSFLFYSYETNAYYSLDAALTEWTTLQTPSQDCAFTSDGTRCCYLQDRLLYVQDRATGDARRVPLEAELRFTDLVGLLGESDDLVLRVCLSDDSLDTALIAVDIDSGKVKLLQAEPNSLSAFGDDEWLLLSYDWDSESYVLRFGSLADGTGYRADTAAFLTTNLSYEPIEGSPYLMGLIEPDPEPREDGTQQEQNTLLYRLGETVSCCDLSTYGVHAALWNAYYLPDEGLLLADVYEDGAAHCLLIDCSELTFTPVCTAEPLSFSAVDEALLKSWQQERDGGETPDALLSVRAYADELEARYGIRILLSDQCTAACSYADHAVTTTDKAGYSNEAKLLTKAIKQLDAALKLYPADYFRQFQNGAGDGGLRFLPVAAIESDYGVVGLHFPRGVWFNIVFDLSQDELAPTLHHELWHAAEEKIGSGDNALTDGRFAACNPDGFCYYETYEYDDPDSARYTLYGDGEVYFVDGYARTFACEDRARLMEYVMSYDGAGAALLSHAPLRAKFLLMLEALYDAFDTSTWTDPYWERLL